MKPAECHPDRKHYAFGKCQSCYQPEHYRRNEASYKAKRKVYDAKNRTKINVQMREYRAKNEVRFATYERQRLLAKYGLTETDYNTMLGRQNGGCAICKRKVRMYIDHCHETGRVRGLLCNNCNLALGHLKDDLSLIQRAGEYLRESHS